MNPATQTLVDKVGAIGSAVTSRITDAVNGLRGNAVDGAAISSALDQLKVDLLAAIDTAIPAPPSEPGETTL